MDKASKKIVFSGIKPSGDFHIGNFFGAIKQWLEGQAIYQNIFCIVDLHAITVPQEPKTLKANIRKLATLYLASGLDPQQSIIFIQSRVKAHAELGWILNCFTPMGWLRRMTQYKDKKIKAGSEGVSVGLFDYPVLMAADILLYSTDLVPVGEDQRQHVELARDLAQRFNALFGPIFSLPELLLPKIGSRIMSLNEPNKKMSKSDEAKAGAILLTDSADEIREKIMKAATDSENKISFDQTSAGIFNLLTIYKSFTALEKKVIEEKFQGKSYLEFKKDLAEKVIFGLKPLQEKYQELIQNQDYIEKVLEAGAAKATALAEAKLEQVKKKVGLG